MCATSNERGVINATALHNSPGTLINLNMQRHLPCLLSSKTVLYC